MNNAICPIMSTAVYDDFRKGTYPLFIDFMGDKCQLWVIKIYENGSSGGYCAFEQ
jgi:hypothetical protein